MSRGGKDGNNAFTYDSKMRKCTQIDGQDILKLSPPMSFVKYMLNHRDDKTDSNAPIKSNGRSSPFLSKHALSQFWIKAVRKGDYNLVRFIFQMNEKEGLLYLKK